MWYALLTPRFDDIAFVIKTIVAGPSWQCRFYFALVATLQQKFGVVIRGRRLKAGLSQEALAHAAGLHPTYVSLLERGKRAATIVVVERLARALGTSMVDLVRPLERRTGTAPPEPSDGPEAG